MSNQQLALSSPDAGVLFVHDPELSQYNFGPDHPLRPRRHLLLVDLLKEAGMLQTDGPEMLFQQQASREELLLVHSPAYVAAVERLSAGGTEDADTLDAETYGFEMGDNPIFPGMHEASARIVGGTLAACRAVMSGQARHVFNATGGFHHAMPDRASGFCIYNDAAVAIAAMLQEYEARILYVDFDAHHGDGVQAAFYDEPRVMTISFHETGRYLFPGTGDLLELGTGAGRGLSVNIPLEAFTEDESWLEAVSALLPSLVHTFHPDLIISQHGCDTHAWDPLTHLSLTTRAAAAQAALTHALAHEHCQGRWVALGGGGYEMYRVVPRAWALVWSELSGRPLPEQIPPAWLERWQPESRELLPPTFLDHPADFPPKPRRAEIERYNRRVVAQARRLFLPARVRHAYPQVADFAFPAARAEASSTGVPDLLRHSGKAAESRVRALETPRGTILLRDWCPPSLVERLHADEGLHAFARLAEREKALLKRIASGPECELVVAHTPDGQLIGQVSICAADDWWEGIPDLYEVAVEVSSNWRGLGLSKALLRFALEPNYFDDVMLFALGFAWHWDLEGMGLGSMAYAQMIRRLFESVGFEKMAANEPNLHLDPANIFLARVGRNVSPEIAGLFHARLRAPTSLYS
jgi:acetoin utilization deacetylase AcuC-like enzyme/GNAT superfamily N-acetyltransferase